MSDVQFVSAKQMKSLEHYAAALVTGVISLKTLESFHTEAFKLGLLDEDEQETGKTILWEIQRILALYQAQIQHVLDRTKLDEESIINHLKTMVPDVRLPRKRKTKKD